MILKMPTGKRAQAPAAIPLPPPFTPDIMAALRAEVRGGARHECEEWTDHRRICQLCDRRIPYDERNRR